MRKTNEETAGWMAALVRWFRFEGEPALGPRHLPVTELVRGRPGAWGIRADGASCDSAAWFW
jgi:hypothetical protein